MPQPKIGSSAGEMKKALREKKKEKYLLRLYVAGATTKSNRAIANLKRVCEEHLKGRFDLEVVDISRYPTLAKGQQIIATPTLIKDLPQPLRKLIGDMSDTERILVGLGLHAKEWDREKRSGAAA